MHRRDLFRGVAALSAVAGCARIRRSAAPSRRVRPGDPAWPSDASWNRLRREVGGRLIRPELPPFDAGQSRNPYHLGDQPALTQTSGWVDAWTSAPSAYAVAAAHTADVVAAVNFARDHRLRLVVRGGGHSYQGTSSSADSLLVWTRAMNDITLHDAFAPQGCAPTATPQPAVTVGAGAIWMRVYDAVTTGAGRYVQGGGCTTVGVAGLVQSGGFGSFSKNFGLAAAGLLEAEIVTADGTVRIANACANPDLFWALKGGGGGTFGVVTRLTLRTRELPETFGGVFGTLQARSDTAFRGLLSRIVGFYGQRLFNPHWGEQIRFLRRNAVNIAMVFQGLSRREAADVWRPFVDWVATATGDIAWEAPLQIAALPARHLWDAGFLKQHAPHLIAADERPGASERDFVWAGDRGEAGQVLHGYRSTWLPSALLAESGQRALVDALFAASRHWNVALHFNKGLAGAPVDELVAARDTAMNPLALDAFALAIMAGNSPPTGSSGAPSDVAAARRDAGAINRSMDALAAVLTQPGSYVAESNFFEPDWQRSFWGANYPRLAAVKWRYDPGGLFVVHHGVGSEDWSPDGFTRRGRR